MTTIAFLLTLSGILWYIIDRIKPMWSEVKFGNYITMGVALAGGLALSFAFNLDILYSLGIFQEASVLGKIVTAVAFMSGSSGISELVKFFKKGEE